MVNLKDIVSKVKGALVATDNRDASVLKALAQRDWDAVWQALPAEPAAVEAKWLAQIAVLDAAFAQHITAYVNGEVAGFDIDPFGHVTEAAFNVFGRPLDDFSYNRTGLYVRGLPQQPLNFLYRVQWYRLLLQAAPQSVAKTERWQLVWQVLAHAHSSYSRHHGASKHQWSVAFEELTYILPLQWRCALGEDAGTHIPSTTLAQLQQLFGVADWQNTEDILDTLFDRNHGVSRLLRCTDLDAWLCGHVGAINVWRENHSYYRNFNGLLRYASGRPVLHVPLLAVWADTLLERNVDSRLLAVGIVRQMDVAVVGTYLQQTAAVADKPAAVLAKFADSLTFLGRAYQPVLEQWQAAAKTTAAKKPFATAISKLALQDLQQQCNLVFAPAASLGTDLPEAETVAALHEVVSTRVQYMEQQLDWANTRLQQCEQTDVSQLDAQELAWHQQSKDSATEDATRLQATLGCLKQLEAADYQRWYQHLQNRIPLDEADAVMVFDQYHHYVRSNCVLETDSWRPCHTAAQFGLWNSTALCYATGNLLDSADWRSIVAHLRDIGRDDAEDVMWTVMDNHYISEERWRHAVPFLLQNSLILEQTWGIQPVLNVANKLDSDDVFAALQAFATIPQNLQYPLGLWAYSSNRSNREQAQALLGKQDNALAWAVWGLNHDYADMRKLSVAWLLGLQDAQAEVSALLHGRMLVEEDTKLRVQLLQGLIALQADVSAYLSEAALLAEVAPVMAKKRPKAIEWVDWASLPALHWQDGRPVSPELLEGWLRLAMQMKEASGEGMWQIYLGLLQADSQQALGMYVLRQFVAEDTRPMSPEELGELIDKEAPRKLKKYQQDYANYPNYHSSYANITEDEVKQELTEQYGRYNEKQTALPHKGMLALTAAVAADEWYRTFRFYQRDFAYKTKQLGALVQAAAASDNAAVLPLIASLDVKASGNYIRSLSRTTIAEYQERHEWTDEQIADYLVGSFGMDGFGRLQLNYGERAFHLRLHVDGEWGIADEAGKELRALPPARKTEDADWVKTVKAQFASIKKDVKTELKRQQQRLYVAMCLQRQWDGQTWLAVVAQQPVMRLLAQRLVWRLQQDGQTLFVRLDEQGELLDAADEVHEMADTAQVSLAHGTHMDADTIPAWRQHFADYQIEPLFEQFNVLPEGVFTDNSSAQFEGHAIPYYSLRSCVAKLGFNVSSYDYYGEDRFSLQLDGEHSIALTFEAQGGLGYGFDRSNVMLWLRHAHIHSEANNEAQAASTVLKAEAHAAYQAAANAGNGKDPKWKKSA